MKSLIHEIHRRSLWQVLGIYLAVSWIVLQVVDVLGNNFGLPDWVPPAALVLLLLGLPVVIATAFVQEGMTTREPEAPRQSLADVGEVPPPPASEPAGHRRVFTWRNAVIGGGAAFALLGVLTAGYLFMRSAGIGPAATLVAQGVFEDGARVVLADFESADPELAEVVTGALRIDLLQSQTIRVVERSELEGALGRMQLEPNAPVTSEVARELAAREGYGAVILGEIGTAGAGYVLTASIVGGEEWTSLAAFRSTARDEDGLIDAIEDLSRDIRDKSGESLRSVANSPSLARVSTSSIEALRAYSRAEALEDDADRVGAVELYERAVEIDPDFAMAHRKIAVVLGNMGIRRTDQVAALRRAYELRDRLPQTEAYLAEANYQSAVRGDRPATIRAYERVLDVDPRNTAALNNLALRYHDMGRREEAEELLERALDVEAFQVAFSNLAGTRYTLGDLEGAEAVIDLAQEALPGTASLMERMRLGLVMNAAEYERAEGLLDAFEERFPGDRDRVRAATAGYVLDALGGSFREARARVDDFDAAPTWAGHPFVMSYYRNILTAVAGDTAAAVRGLLADFDAVREDFGPGERLYGFLVPVLLDLGAEAPAATLLDEWRQEVPEEELGIQGHDARRESAARFAAVRGDHAGAIRGWEAYERACPGACALMAALGMAETHDAAGNREEAIHHYERYLTDLSNRHFIDAVERAVVLERLGYLHGETGDPDEAARYLRAFVDLWSDADPELQPRVDAARARLAELGGEAE